MEQKKIWGKRMFTLIARKLEKKVVNMSVFLML